MVKRIFKKTRKQRAGKFIRKGTYGCGYYPALKCEGETEREPGLFSKLMRKIDAIDEFKQHDLLFPIDPNQSYLLYPLKMCKPNLESFKSGDPNNNTKNCNDLFVKNNDKMILMYNNGGPDLSRINLKAEDYAPFFRDLVQLFEGLKLMHDNNVVHLDIKEENTVHERISSNPIAYRFRYIDFGLSRDAESQIGLFNSLFTVNYFSFPYELRFIHPRFEQEDITNSSVIKFIENSYDLTTFNFFYPSSYILSDYASNPQAINYAKKCFEETFDQYENSEISASDIQKGTDVFALGSLLSYIYGSLIGHRWLRNTVVPIISIPTVKIKNVNDVLYSGFTAINTMEEGPIKEWNQRVANQISFPIYHLIKAMIHFKFDHRYTIDQALEAYKQLIPAMEELFSKENIEKYHSHIYTHLAPVAPPNQKNTTRKSKLQRQKGSRNLSGFITNNSSPSNINNLIE